MERLLERLWPLLPLEWLSCERAVGGRSAWVPSAVPSLEGELGARWDVAWDVAWALAWALDWALDWALAWAGELDALERRWLCWSRVRGEG